NFAGDVETVLIAIEELVVDVHRERDRDLLLEGPPDAAVLLDGDHDLRRYRWLLRIARSAALHEERAAVAAADVEHGCDPLVEEELVPLRVECLRRLEISTP